MWLLRNRRLVRVAAVAVRVVDAVLVAALLAPPSHRAAAAARRRGRHSAAAGVDAERSRVPDCDTGAGRACGLRRLVAEAHGRGCDRLVLARAVHARLLRAVALRLRLAAGIATEDGGFGRPPRTGVRAAPADGRDGARGRGHADLDRTRGLAPARAATDDMDRAVPGGGRPVADRRRDRRAIGTGDRLCADLRVARAGYRAAGAARRRRHLRAGGQSADGRARDARLSRLDTIRSAGRRGSVPRRPAARQPPQHRG